MKKIIISVLVICIALVSAACGNMRVDTPVVSPVPYVETDIDDGVVRDNDGIISNNDTAADEHNAYNNRVSRGTVDIENKNTAAADNR